MSKNQEKNTQADNTGKANADQQKKIQALQAQLEAAKAENNELEQSVKEKEGIITSQQVKLDNAKAVVEDDVVYCFGAGTGQKAMKRSEYLKQKAKDEKQKKQ